MSTSPPNYFRSVFHTLNAKFLIVLLNAGTGIISARALHPVGRGELAAITLWPLVLSGALTLGLPSALTFQIQRRPALKAELTMTAALMAFAVGCIGSALAIAFLPLLLRHYPPEVIFIARCLMPNLIIGLLLLIGRASLEGEHQFGKSGSVVVIPPLLALVFLVTLMLAHRLTPATAGVSYILSGIPAFGYLFYKVPLSIHQSLANFQSSARKLMSYGIRSYGIDLCGTVSLYIDQALVVGLLSPGAMGTYVVSLSLSRITSVPHQALASVLFPSLVNIEKAKAGRIVNRMLRIGGTISFVATGAIFVLGHLLLSFLYGSAFAKDSIILPVLTLEAGLSGCVLIAAQTFMAYNRPGLITVQQVIGLLASLPLLIVLVPRYGIRGAAASILISTCIRLVFILVSTRRAFGVLPSLLLDGDSVQWLRDRWRLRRQPPVLMPFVGGTE